MDYFVVEPAFQPLFEQLGLGDCAQTIRFFAESQPVVFKKSWLTAATLGSEENSTPVFYKQYSFAKPSWKFLGRASKARREFENYAVFQQLNIRCADRIACGEQRDALGRLKRAFIITRAVPDTITLLKFIRKNYPNRATPESQKMRRIIIEQLGEMTRQIHEARFFHNDLFWRNILVQWSPGEDPKLWWIDCPRGRFSRGIFQSRRRIKDLAALDKSAKKLFSLRERVHLVKIYLGQKRLDDESRRLIRDTIDYGKDRWLEE